MATTRIGLMGFGRIGRNVMRLLHDREDLDVVAISDIADPKALTYLLKYDSLYGRFPAPVSYSDGTLAYGSKQVAFLNAREPGDADWEALGVDVVLETTSRYRSKAALDKHLAAGAKKVILTSSPETPGEIPLLLRGINDDVLGPDVDQIALGSNTSNAAAPILKTINDELGIKRAFMTVVKAMSNAGRLADVPTDSFRTSRAAGENIIPADTNSAEIITQALPELEDKLLVVALNVPVVDGSTVDMVVDVERSTDVEEVNSVVKKAVETDYQGIIEYVADPIVSSDVRLTSHSGVYDSLAAMVTGGTLVKTITWFNNGWGYSNRVVEVTSSVANYLNGGN
ncbi:MAG TPA: glyceraldehyde 3-phosphate dehydrogenase NAD-binding domain-containing protein [Acidimicrobiia bacterium]